MARILASWSDYTQPRQPQNKQRQQSPYPVILRALGSMSSIAIYQQLVQILRANRVGNDHSGNTLSVTQANVISSEAASRNGKLNFWWSRNSIPAKPIMRNVAGVSGLTGNPVVI